mmetsp:Transcript_1854/g.4276  ORF Transcript_1854/g.4276 Transcript_1854/m.4276 type:complete len:335 (-) Transcript_1854:109-1113(-)
MSRAFSSLLSFTVCEVVSEQCLSVSVPLLKLSYDRPLKCVSLFFFVVVLVCFFNIVELLLIGFCRLYCNEDVSIRNAFVEEQSRTKNTNRDRFRTSIPAAGRGADGYIVSLARGTVQTRGRASPNRGELLTVVDADVVFGPVAFHIKLGNGEIGVAGVHFPGFPSALALSGRLLRAVAALLDEDFFAPAAAVKLGGRGGGGGGHHLFADCACRGKALRGPRAALLILRLLQHLNASRRGVIRAVAILVLLVRVLAAAATLRRVNRLAPLAVLLRGVANLHLLAHLSVEQTPLRKNLAPLPAVGLSPGLVHDLEGAYSDTAMQSTTAQAGPYAGL